MDKEDDSNLDDLPDNSNRIEIFCNRFSADFLVPNDDFERAIRQVDIDVECINQLADTYKVSRELVSRKLLDKGLLNKKFYSEQARKWNKQKDRKVAGGNYYFNQIIYLGGDYIDLAFSKYNQNKISIDQLTDFLNIKTKNIGKFEDIFMGKSA